MRRPVLTGLVAIVIAGWATATYPRPSTAAATVYGHEIPKSLLQKWVKQASNSDAFKIETGLTGDTGSEVRLVSQQDLTLLIQRQVLGHEASRLGVDVSKDQVRRAEDRFLAGQGITTKAQFKGLVAGDPIARAAFKRSMYMQVLQNNLERKVDALNTPSRSEMRSYFQQHSWRYSESLAQHIKLLLTSESLARSLSARLRSVAPADQGRLFSRLARRYSRDPATSSKGGRLGWVLNRTFSLTQPKLGRALATLPVGVVSRPIQTPNGIEIVRVIDRRTPAFSSAVDQVEGDMLSGDNQLYLAYQRFLERSYRKAHVTVDPRYGHFDMTSFEVTDVVPTPTPLPSVTP